jgi:hypothetical protein
VKQLKFGKIKIYILKLYYILIIKTTMRKYILTSILGLLTFVGFGQYTVFSENIGTTAPNSSPYPLVTGYTGWITSLTFGATISSSPVMSAADVRTTATSTGYVGASGGSNVFFTNTVGKNFQISSISTIGKFNLKLSFGAFKSATASNMSELILEFSTNGTTYTTLTIPSQPIGVGTATWRLIPQISLPSSVDNISNLRLRWRQTGTTIGTPPVLVQFRIDDIKLTYETALPITLISFEGSKKEDYNLLKWSTASEIDNDYFLLERSQDGTNWININSTDGMGNSNTKVDYLFRDFTFTNDVNYYRLTQVDFNGVYETFDIISINNSRKQKQILKITNTLGQEVSKDTKGLLIITYTDGTSEKIMN